MVPFAVFVRTVSQSKHETCLHLKWGLSGFILAERCSQKF